VFFQLHSIVNFATDIPNRSKIDGVRPEVSDRLFNGVVGDGVIKSDGAKAVTNRISDKRLGYSMPFSNIDARGFTAGDSFARLKDPGVDN
jgi:hypothetical protein